MTAFAVLLKRLRLPLIAAPMFRVSGVDLVVAACRNGVIGAFPTANCRSAEELDSWLSAISAAAAEAPWCANLIVHRSNLRMRDDLAVLLRHAPEIVITSVGSPAEVVRPLHDGGALVLSDVGSVRHAERAIEVGADGLILLTAGAGGQTRWLNPFAFVRAVRRLYDGPLVLVGGIGDGQALAAAVKLGCDLGYMGTRFIATVEEHGPTGLQTNAGQQQCRRRSTDPSLHRVADQYTARVGCGGGARSGSFAGTRRDRCRQGPGHGSAAALAGYWSARAQRFLGDRYRAGRGFDRVGDGGIPGCVEG
jgi:Nitronate monooxygenase